MCAKSLSIQDVYLTSWLGTLALLDLFVFDTSYICLDRSGLRILIVDDDDDDDNHLTFFALRYLVSDRVFFFAFLLRPMS